MARKNPFQQALILAAILSLGIALTIRYGLGLHWLIATLAAVNVVTFALYAYDKSIAGSGATRVPEAVLHLFALAGGSPAAFAAQQILRHKSSKRAFLIRFWCIAGAQLLALAWFMTHTAAAH